MWRRQQHRDRPQHVVVDGLSHSTSPRHQSPIRPSRLQESKVRKVCYCIVLHAGALVSPAVLVKQGSSRLSGSRRQQLLHLKTAVTTDVKKALTYTWNL